MKKMMLILVMGMIFCRGIIDAEEVTKSTGTIKKPRLKLLWKKEFDGEVKCFSAFHDGSYIAVGMDKSKLNEEKSKYIYKKSEIILLDRKGKELWRREIGERLGLVKLGNTRPLVIVTNYQKIWVYDEEGNLIWEQFSKWTQGIPIISPDDKYIATVHTGIEGVTPRGLTVFDIKGNKLWNYNPVSSLNVVFIPFNAIFINRDMVAIVVSPICHHENSKKIVPDTSGKVIVFEVNNGKKIYEDTFEYLQDVYEINLESVSYTHLTLPTKA